MLPFEIISLIWNYTSPKYLVIQDPKLLHAYFQRTLNYKLWQVLDHIQDYDQFNTFCEKLSIKDKCINFVRSRIVQKTRQEMKQDPAYMYQRFSTPSAHFYNKSEPCFGDPLNTLEGLEPFPYTFEFSAFYFKNITITIHKYGEEFLFDSILPIPMKTGNIIFRKGLDIHRDNNLPAIIVYNDSKVNQEEWYQNNKRFRYNDLPLIEKYSHHGGHLSVQFWDSDRINNLPSLIRYYKNGDIDCKKWYTKIIEPTTFAYVCHYSKLHNINDLPAVIKYSRCGYVKRREWYNKGILHREVSPAIIDTDAVGNIILEEWWFNDRLYRENGPVIINYYKNGLKSHESWSTCSGPKYYSFPNNKKKVVQNYMKLSQ